MHLEDFSPGQVFTSEPRTITVEDVECFTRLTGDDHPIHQPTTGDRAGSASSDGERAIVHGTLGVALFTGFFRSMGLSEQAQALLDVDWSFVAPMRIGDAITCCLTITRVRRSSGGDRGIVHRAVELRNQDDEILQRGTSHLVVAARCEHPLSPHFDFLSKSSVEQLGEALDEDPAFQEIVAAYDGTIGLSVGGQEAHLRIYRGRIIEASRRSLLGADFVVSISDRDWTRLMTSPENDFMKMAITGCFRTSGSGAEYLRMTRPLITIVDHARTLFQKDLSR